jgi:sensor domain CHASE-containing protein
METNLVPALWIAWGVFALITILLYAYRSVLTRDEEGQIFLDDAFAHEKAVQTAIVSRVNRLQPIVRASVVVSAVMTLAIVGYYVWFATKALFG